MRSRFILPRVASAAPAPASDSSRSSQGSAPCGRVIDAAVGEGDGLEFEVFSSAFRHRQMKPQDHHHRLSPTGTFRT